MLGLCFRIRTSRLAAVAQTPRDSRQHDARTGYFRVPERFPVLTSTGQMQDQDCLTVSELARLLHTTKDAIYRKTSRGEWPYFKAVRRVYFTPDNVRTIVAMSTYGPTAPAPGLPPVGADDDDAPANVRRIRRTQGA